MILSPESATSSASTVNRPSALVQVRVFSFRSGSLVHGLASAPGSADGVSPGETVPTRFHRSIVDSPPNPIRIIASRPASGEKSIRSGENSEEGSISMGPPAPAILPCQPPPTPNMLPAPPAGCLSGRLPAGLRVVAAGLRTPAGVLPRPCPAPAATLPSIFASCPPVRASQTRT